MGTETERATATTTWPGDWIDANPYGNRYWLRDRYAYHTGADLNLNKPRWDMDRGQPVYSIANGVVTYAGHLSENWGNVVVIRHGDVFARYAALGIILVKEGDFVEIGQQIGTVGQHRGGEPYHLHFDISPTTILLTNPGDWPGLTWSRIERDYVDPLKFILENKA